MRILVLYPYIPYPLTCGTYQRTFHLLRELARYHEITLLALAEAGEGMEHRKAFDFCSRVEFVPFVHPPWAKLIPKRLLNPLPASVAHWTVPCLEEKVVRLLQEESYDVVHVCDIVMAQYFRRRGVPLVIDRSRVDLQYQLAEHSHLDFPARTRLLRSEGYVKLWFYEREIASRASLEIVCGPDDEAFLRRWVSVDVPIQVLVNGVDLEYFYPGSVSESRGSVPTVLFCGAMDYNPNIDAMRWFFNEIFGPLRSIIPDLETLIVGKNPTSEVMGFARFPGVAVTGGVPDVRPFYSRAWLQIVPIRIGGGTRLKIVESMAMETPVVSTQIGAQGLNLRHNYNVFLADTAEEFVRVTAQSLLDESVRTRVALAGRKLVQSQYSWKMLGERLNTIYLDYFGGVQPAQASAPTGSVA